MTCGAVPYIAGPPCQHFAISLNGNVSIPNTRDNIHPTMLNAILNGSTISHTRGISTAIISASGQQSTASMHQRRKPIIVPAILSLDRYE
jgi:hypothetical protein